MSFNPLFMDAAIGLSELWDDTGCVVYTVWSCGSS